MTAQDMLTLIGSILIPMLVGFIWVISRQDKSFKSLQAELQQIDRRLSHLEGAFEERGRDPKIYVIKNDSVIEK
jgi:hypothetical protein